VNYYIQYDGEFMHHYRVVDDLKVLHVNETSACINYTYNDIDSKPQVYKPSSKKLFDDALQKTLNNLGIKYGEFKF